MVVVVDSWCREGGGGWCKAGGEKEKKAQGAPNGGSRGVVVQ